MVRKYGKKPYNIVVLHGGPGALGSAAGLARLLSGKYGILEPMQSKHSIGELEEELLDQIKNNCPGKVILVGHSWGAWLAGLFAQRYPEKVKKIILVGCGPLDERYVSQIGERRKENMDLGEAKEYDDLLVRLEKGIGKKDENLKRLGEICDKADGYQEENTSKEQTEVNEVLYGHVWKEVSLLRKTGELSEIFSKIACPIVLLQGAADPHPAIGVIQPLKEKKINIKSYVIDFCGHTPWREKYAKEEFFRILCAELENTR